MKTYEICNTVSGVSLCRYFAQDAATALELMAQDAGYASYAAACEIAPDGDLIVSEVEPLYTVRDGNGDVFDAVSYTHLDVYKRQGRSGDR